MTTPSSETEDRAALKRIAETLRFDYLNEKAAIARLACAFLNESAHEDVSYAASCDLTWVGPKNDWNGLRSAAERVRREWEERILEPALVLYRKMKATKEARISK